MTLHAGRSSIRFARSSRSASLADEWLHKSDARPWPGSQTHHNVRTPRRTGAARGRKDKCMTTAVSGEPTIKTGTSQRANALAERLEQGARALAAFASALNEVEWQTQLPGDGRKVGVIVHHVAT